MQVENRRSTRVMRVLRFEVCILVDGTFLLLLVTLQGSAMYFRPISLFFILTRKSQHEGLIRRIIRV